MKRHKPDGFTLLEMLLAISLLSLITASIMGGVHLGQRSWETNRASEALDEVESALRAVTGLLSKSFLIAPGQNGQVLQKPTTPFLGDVEHCRFVVASDGGAQWGGLILTDIGVDKGPEGEALVVWTKPYRPQEGLAVGNEVMKKTVVAGGLVSIRFSYYGARAQAAGETQGPAWGANWNSVSILPALVSVKIVLRRLGRDLDASAIVALRQ